MNTDLAIAVVTSVINDIVGNAAGAAVSNLSPASPPTGDESHIYIYLYQVAQNPHWINQDLPTRRGDGSLKNKPRIALDLNYLLSFYGSSSDLAPQRLMGAAMRALHAQPIVSHERISEVITGKHHLEPYNPDECFETIRISPLSLSLEDMSKLWSVFFQKPHALSVAYQASVVMIEAEDKLSVALPVDRPVVYVLPLRKPHIDRITVEGDDPRVFPDSAIFITGSDLAGDVVKIRISDHEKVVQPDSAERITVDLSELTGLQAGVCGVQVVHAAMMGEPPELREVIESNVAALVVNPRIEGSPIALPGAPPAVRIKMTPPIGPSQKVYLLLNSLAGTGGVSYPAPSRDEVSTEIDFEVPDLKGDRYFVRVQVDGAESPVNFDDSSPQVVVYVIRDNLQPPKYNSSDKTLTLTVDPAVQEGQTVVLTIEKTTESRSYSFNSEAVENGGNKVIFELTEVETGLYRIGLKIEGAQAINQPEIAIS